MTLPNGISTAYSYDAAGRLTGMKYSKGSTVLRDLVYGYDEINRRTSYSGNTAPEPQETATNTATVDASNRYTSLNGKPVSHDDNGNQTINNAVWDARDRLVGLSGPGFTASFTYDAMGRRTSKTVNGQTKTYHYDGSDLISETGTDYTFGPGIDQPLERKAGQNEYYLSDALGSVIGLADSAGIIKTSYNYSPFGKKQTTGTNSSNPFTFTGREDDGTGYYYYRARYYNPDQKRFIAEDPLGFGGGDTNLQAYVGNNPINAIDPTGTKVLVGQHPAFFPTKLNPFNHTAIVLRPDNPNAFKNNPLFQATNGREATLGGQLNGPVDECDPTQDSRIPRPFGNLIGAPNYPGDNPSKLDNLTEVTAPLGQTDTQFINSLINAAASYRDNAPYSPVPTPADPYYNSNSYVSGVLRAVGSQAPSLPNIQPGYSKPLPIPFP
jgi:RHS repeat-associated protein